VAVRPILLFGDPRLETRAAPVTAFGDALEGLVEDLFETAWNAPGLGLAAPQVGLDLALAVVDLSVGGDPSARVVLANPRVVSASGVATVEEGCLSFPDVFVKLSRPNRIVVRAADQLGHWRLITGEGLMAQALCHELDHLRGVLLPHHLGGTRRRLLLRRVARLRRSGRWDAGAAHGRASRGRPGVLG
jgi:peptide deformylase